MEEDKENVSNFELPPIRKTKSAIMEETCLETKLTGNPNVLNFLKRRISTKKD